ncbi:VanZ family protein [Clostridium sporogenes]|uniref:VanZ family protein n=1 Tax=unclassified Clostridium TaxID=2614128 RepID=UPI0013D2E048|nr:VanZ family protein [Clostridium sporogenes]NFS27161.1 VanZ family protein [Clostridium sporogenes]
MVKVILILCFLTSICIGCFQYVATYYRNARTVDINNIILNTLGAVFGYILYDKLLKKVINLLLSLRRGKTITATNKF